jgi:putative ABC transport system substrate-binding protein
MDRRTWVAMALGASLGMASDSRAQSKATTRRIGFLSLFARAEVDAFFKELKPELEKLGWTEGRNLEFLDVRTTEGSSESLPALVTELMAQHPDLILVQTVPATRALMQATKSTPIVMIGVGSPLEVGIIPDYSRPGGNVTGSSYLADESMIKLLQFLKEAAPRLRSVAVFSNPTNAAAGPMIEKLRQAAASLGVQLQKVEVSGKGDFEAAFAAIRRANTESILLPPEQLVRANRGALADFAQAHGLPLAIAGSSRYLPTSGLISYGPTTTQYAQISARYVDRILRGTPPGDLAVEQPSRFEMVINLKTAKALGLTIPPSLLQLAELRG